MKIYLVGGAVRDELLQIPASDKDWVVVGASPDEMTQYGFRPVGKDFPVFLHPQSQEEYALARTERKTAAGYHGFSFNTSKDVTLEQDLQRRDLTINAIAKDDNGNLIDPWGGIADLHNRVLRHVSPAFAEDPLRVLRVARFAAKLADFGFTIATDTLHLMRTLSNSGELQTLAAERIWQELKTALGYPRPEPFFTAMRECGALAIVLPELDNLFGLPQPTPYPQQIDTATHTMMALRHSCLLTRHTAPRFATLCHDLGMGATPPILLPSQQYDGKRGAAICKTVCARLKTPAEYRDLAILTARFHPLCHRAPELAPDSLLSLLEQTDALRRGQRFEQFLVCCTADARGQPGAESASYPQANYLRSAVQSLAQIDTGAIAARHSAAGGLAIAKAIRTARLAALTEHSNRTPQA